MSEQATLFAAERNPDWPEHNCAFDSVTAAARRKLGAPETWEWYKWERLPGDDMLVEGGVPSNPNAKRGKDRWRGVKGERVVVTVADADAARADYERTTGICAACGGSRYKWSGWSREHGSRFRPCDRCKSTGRAVGAP